MVVVVELCVVGIQMAWAQYLPNEFIGYCLDSQDSMKEFHYSWILLLLAMVL